MIEAPHLKKNHRQLREILHVTEEAVGSNRKYIYMEGEEMRFRKVHISKVMKTMSTQHNWAHVRKQWTSSNFFYIYLV